MLLLRAVNVSSIFEFGAEFHDCLSEDPQGNPPFSPFFGATLMLLLRAVHVSSIFEFGVEFHDCLVQFSILNPFSESHELRFRSCVIHPRVWSHA